MKIEQYHLQMTREDVASYYTLKTDHEKRSAYVTLSLILMGVYVMAPILFVKTFFGGGRLSEQLDLILGNVKHCNILLNLILCLCLIIGILSICLTQNAYRAGKLFHLLQTQQDLPSMLQYVHRMTEDEAWVYITCIILFKTYLYSYIDEEGKLVVVYEDNKKRCYYETFDYERIRDQYQDQPMLLLNTDGIRVIEN